MGTIMIVDTIDTTRNNNTSNIVLSDHFHLEIETISIFDESSVHFNSTFKSHVCQNSISNVYLQSVEKDG